MEPTLKVGQRVLVNRLGMHFNGPHVGEIVVFHPQEGGVNFIKRIVAGPGDTLYIKNGHAYRNGKRESDSYIASCEGGSECNFPTPIKIPAGHWFMMGDNRGESDDSRFWGPVPTSWIIGGAFATYWPPNRIGIL